MAALNTQMASHTASLISIETKVGLSTASLARLRTDFEAHVAATGNGRRLQVPLAAGGGGIGIGAALLAIAGKIAGWW